MIGVRFKAQQIAELNIAAYQRDELLGSEPGICKGQGARCNRALQVGLDLKTLTLGSGTPKHLAESGEASDFGKNDPVHLSLIHI